MKPYFLLLLSLSLSLVEGQNQQAVEDRVKNALGPHYAALLKMSPSEKEVFDDMITELLDGQMTVPEFMNVLHHTSPAVYKILRPLTVHYLDVDPRKVEEGTRVFVAKIVEKLNELKMARTNGLLTKKSNTNEKDLKKKELSKIQKLTDEKVVDVADQLGDIKKTKQSSPIDFIDIIARHFKLKKEEKEVIGDMVMELVEGQMTAEEFLDVLSHTSPSIHAALTRIVSSINLNRVAKTLKLGNYEKEVTDVVEDMLHELVHGQMSIEEFLSSLEHVAPSAHRLLADLHTRVAGLKEKAAKEFVKKVTHALREIGKALFANKDGEISKAHKDKEVMVQLTNVVKDYGALGRNSEAASEELNETFPDLLAIGQAASINKSQVGGYL